MCVESSGCEKGQELFGGEAQWVEGSLLESKD